MSSQIVREIRPSVVMIERRKVGAVMASNILGTAFVADNAGYLLTAAHVVRGVDPEDLIVRTMFNLAGEYAMSSGRVEAVFLHSESDVAVIRVHRSLTKGRALRMEPAGPEVGDDVLMLGYALGTELTFCDDILGSASPKSPTPLAFRGSVSGLVPHDGRPVKVVVIDITTFAGNSGSPVVRAADGSVVGIHIRGVDRRVGYALPIELGVNLLGSVGAGASDSMPPASTLVGAQIDPGLAINALLEVLEQAADILNHQRGSRPDPRLIAEELVEQLGRERAVRRAPAVGARAL